jgi:hypothetical protein
MVACPNLQHNLMRSMRLRPELITLHNFSPDPYSFCYNRSAVLKTANWIRTIGVIMKPSTVSRLSAARNFFCRSDIGILSSKVHRGWLGLSFCVCVVFYRYRPRDLSIPRLGILQKSDRFNKLTEADKSLVRIICGVLLRKSFTINKKKICYNKKIT